MFSKIGKVYQCLNEEEMLKTANVLEKEGFKVRRDINSLGGYIVIVEGYR